jgi:hypothetical protein
MAAAMMMACLRSCWRCSSMSPARMGGFAEEGDSILQQSASRCGGWCGLCGCGAAYRTDAATAQSRGGEAIGQNSGLFRSNSNTVAKDSSEAL